MAKYTHLVHFVADPDLIEKLDDFRFQNRFDYRAEAIRWLLEWGLQQAPTVERKRKDED